MARHYSPYTLIDATGEPTRGDDNQGDLQALAEPGDTIVDRQGNVLWTCPDDQLDEEEAA